MKSATIADVAARAGVAKSTVSAVLNNKEGVKESTRRTILRAIDELKYRPSAAARRGFRTRPDHRSITFLIKEAQNPYYAEALSGIQSVARERGYLVSAASSEGDYEMEQAIVEQSMKQDVTGLIIAPVLNDESDLSHLFELKRNNVPFVLLEAIRGVRASLVDIDNEAASREAVRHLIEHGHSRIAHFAGPRYSEHSQERAQGVRRAFSESHLALDESQIMPVGDSADDGYRAGLGYFAAGSRDRPTAVTCYNDLVAIGLLRALRELDIRVPEDVSVVGFDDLGILEYLSVPLTTVRVPKFEMGRLAAEMLIRQIEDTAESTVDRVLLDARLVVRASTAPLSASAAPSPALAG